MILDFGTYPPTPPWAADTSQTADPAARAPSARALMRVAELTARAADARAKSALANYVRAREAADTAAQAYKDGPTIGRRQAATQAIADARNAREVAITAARVAKSACDNALMIHEAYAPSQEGR